MTRDTIIIESNAHTGIVSTAANWTLIVGDQNRELLLRLRRLKLQMHFVQNILIKCALIESSTHLDW